MELSDLNKRKIAEVGVMAIHQEGVPSHDKTERIMKAGVSAIPAPAAVEEAASLGSVFKSAAEELSRKEKTGGTADTAADDSLAAAAQASRSRVMEYGVMSMPRAFSSQADEADQKAKEAMEAGVSSIRE